MIPLSHVGCDNALCIIFGVVMHDMGIYCSFCNKSSCLWSLYRFLMHLLEHRHAPLILKSSIAPVPFSLPTNLGSFFKGHLMISSLITPTCLELLAPAVMLVWLLMLLLTSGEQKGSFRCQNMKMTWKFSDSLHCLVLFLMVTFSMTMIGMGCFAASLPWEYLGMMRREVDSFLLWQLLLGSSGISLRNALACQREREPNSISASFNFSLTLRVDLVIYVMLKRFTDPFVTSLLFTLMVILICLPFLTSCLPFMVMSLLQSTPCTH